MKKEILFIIDTMHIGGAEKSLITVLNLIDYSKYNVDLFLLRHEGEFLNQIPKEVNLLEEDKKYKIFAKNRKLSILKYFLKFDFKSSFYSLLWNIGVIISRIKKEKLFIGWKYIEKLLNKIEKEYDTSVAYLERKSIYFSIDKVNAKNKIGFIHNNYLDYPFDYELDKKYFSDLDTIATVSEYCKDSLTKTFPEYKDKIVVIENVILKKTIVDLAEEKIYNYNIKENVTNIVSVGRLTYQKGFDNAIRICKKLIDKNISINWYVVGEGEDRNKLEKMIKENNLEDVFFLVGKDLNPYKWMNIADIYVQPSRFEGKAITLEEAKKLNKVVITSLNCIKDYNSGEEILAKDIDDFTEKIIELINNKELKEKFIEKYRSNGDNIEEFEKLNKLL